MGIPVNGPKAYADGIEVHGLTRVDVAWTAQDVTLGARIGLTFASMSRLDWDATADILSGCGKLRVVTPPSIPGIQGGSDATFVVMPGSVLGFWDEGKPLKVDLGGSLSLEAEQVSSGLPPAASKAELDGKPIPGLADAQVVVTQRQDFGPNPVPPLTHVRLIFYPCSQKEWAETAALLNSAGTLHVEVPIAATGKILEFLFPATGPACDKWKGGFPLGFVFQVAPADDLSQEAVAELVPKSSPKTLLTSLNWGETSVEAALLDGSDPFDSSGTHDFDFVPDAAPDPAAVILSGEELPGAVVLARSEDWVDLALPGPCREIVKDLTASIDLGVLSFPDPEDPFGQTRAFMNVKLGEIEFLEKGKVRVWASGMKPQGRPLQGYGPEPTTVGTECEGIFKQIDAEYVGKVEVWAPKPEPPWLPLPTKTEEPTFMYFDGSTWKGFYEAEFTPTCAEAKDPARFLADESAVDERRILAVTWDDPQGPRVLDSLALVGLSQEVGEPFVARFLDFTFPDAPLLEIPVARIRRVDSAETQTLPLRWLAASSGERSYTRVAKKYPSYDLSPAVEWGTSTQGLIWVLWGMTRGSGLPELRLWKPCSEAFKSAGSSTFWFAGFSRAGHQLRARFRPWDNGGEEESIPLDDLEEIRVLGLPRDVGPGAALPVKAPTLPAGPGFAGAASGRRRFLKE